jgi:hypothetical protein
MEWHLRIYKIEVHPNPFHNLEMLTSLQPGKSKQVEL